jgi:hypothetical protein
VTSDLFDLAYSQFHPGAVNVSFTVGSVACLAVISIAATGTGSRSFAVAVA